MNIMEGNELLNFIDGRYFHWLEYAIYKSKQYHIEDEAEDILYKVICELLEKKNDSRLIDFMHEKKKNGTTLDFYVLGAIKYKVLQWQTFHQLKSSRKKIGFVLCESLPVDCMSYDRQEKSLSQQLQDFHDWVIDLLNRLDIPSNYRQLFIFYYMECCPVKDWEGPESIATRYRILERVLDLVRQELKKAMKM